MPSLQGFAAHREAKSGPSLSGPLPSFDKMPHLLYLYLEGNTLQGPLPNNFLNGSSSVRFVGLGSNHLTGTIPSEIEAFDKLHFEIGGNQIQQFPFGICNKTNWMTGSIASFGCEGFLCQPGWASPVGRSVNATVMCKQCASGDQGAPFYGSLSCGIPSEREILVRLYQDLSGDKWHRNDFWLSKADICDWYGIACVKGQVVEVNLRGNNLCGTPGPGLFFLPSLQILSLYSNPITFSFENIGLATKLQELHLGSTNLHSLRGVGEAQSLLSLDARFTQLEGTFPDELTTLSNLRALSLANNRLTGTLPQNMGALRDLVLLNLQSNELSGTLPAFDDVFFLTHLDLSDNLLTGSISKSFLSGLSTNNEPTIRLSRNALTGIVPDEFNRFHRMSLYLADNHLLGLPLTLCGNGDWNNGDVKYQGCNGILCPPKSYSPYGRSTDDIDCMSCPGSFYYGATSCDTAISTASGLEASPFLIVQVLMLLEVLMVLLWL